ncbi:LPXTG cell wall anchor domain-containing protein [Periweissella cryptocerci]|uniref:LPXTG cell wall anchor domain-containing protein n=1 Tax=Periweissella cryptocerci TaxID=2506420 RepID=A0A4P6YRL1_9LACO|nr:leucine-rich repeat protein [Periweissella cryptocerci]QBO35256.1 LPXTG cell wall anchor domain-containing protein [Periweissella cryptocerci]
MKTEMTPHYKMYKHGKQWVYASLTTVTLLSGFGATPVVLAEELATERTEVSKQSEPDAEPTPNVTDPTLPLPAPELSPEPTTVEYSSDVKVTTENNLPSEVQVNNAPEVTSLDSTKTQQENTTKAASPVKEKGPRNGSGDVHHGAFTKADFTFDSAGTTITGFSSTFTSGDYKNWDGVLTFAPELSDVIGIGASAFASKAIDSVDFSNLTELQKMGDSAFAGTSIETLNLRPLRNLQTIGDGAFVITNLTNVLFDNPNLTSIGNNAFYNATNLTTIDFSSLISLQQIGRSAFFNCTNLQSVIFDDLPALTSIGLQAFSQCINLETFKFDNLDTLTTISDNAFFQCKKLNTPNFDNLQALVSIGKEAFNQCNAFKTIKLEHLQSLTSIGINAFASCTSMESIQIIDLPKLTTLAAQAFNNNPNVKSIEVDNLPLLTSIPNDVFYGCTSAESLTLTNMPALLSIGNHAFYNFHALTQINVDDLNASLNINSTAFDSVKNNGIVRPTNIGNALITAQKFVDSINSWNGYYQNDSTWKIAGTVSHKYLDQFDHEITVDINNEPITPWTQWGLINDQYDAPSAPLIAGYGEPVLESGTLNGAMTGGPQEIIYRYQALPLAAQTVTIYRVDTNGVEIEDPETIDGTVDDDLDLTPKGYDNYDFTELYGSDLPGTSARLVPDLNWLRADELANTTLKLGANNGRSYKFVYTAKSTGGDTTPGTGPNIIPGDNTDTSTPDGKPTPTPDNTTPETDLNPGKLPSSGDSTDEPTAQPNVSKVPSKNPSASNKRPNHLPGSGGNTTGTNRTTDLSAPTAANNNAQPTTGTLPKAGSRENSAPRTLGLLLLTTILGWFAFIKRRQS